MPIISQAGITIANTTLDSPIVVAAPGVRFQNVLMRGSHPDHIILETGPHTTVDHCSLQAHPVGQRAGIRVHSANVQVLNSSVRGITRYPGAPWTDCQAIGAVSHTKNLLVDGCYLEASSENILFGGGDPSSEADIPQDILIRRCTLTKPLTWRALEAANTKNLFELKNAKRVVLEDCDLSFSWVQGQTGWGILLTVRNQDGNAPFSTIEDITIRRNTFRHMAGGIQILGQDYTHPSQRLRRVLFDNNNFYDISPTWGHNGRFIQIDGGDDMTFQGNSMRGPEGNSGFYFVDGLAAPVRNLVVRNHTFDEGEYGIFGDGGLLGVDALNHYAPDYSWEGVTVHRGTSGRNIRYPAGTTVVG